MTSYQRSIANKDLSRTVFEINSDFSQKSQKIFPPLCIVKEAGAEGVPLGIGYRRWEPEN